MESVLRLLARSYLYQEVTAHFLSYDERKTLYGLDAALELHIMEETIEQLRADVKGLRKTIRWLRKAGDDDRKFI